MRVEGAQKEPSCSARRTVEERRQHFRSWAVWAPRTATTVAPVPGMHLIAPGGSIGSQPLERRDIEAWRVYGSSAGRDDEGSGGGCKDVQSTATQARARVFFNGPAFRAKLVTGDCAPSPIKAGELRFTI